MTEITVAICTYKRIEIQKTLTSIADQILPENVYIRVIIADNDVEPTMRQLIEETAKSLGITLTYIHAPSRNISIARNACLINCETQWLVFIDDDETASNTWLSAHSGSPFSKGPRNPVMRAHQRSDNLTETICPIFPAMHDPARH